MPRRAEPAARREHQRQGITSAQQITCQPPSSASASPFRIAEAADDNRRQHQQIAAE